MKKIFSLFALLASITASATVTVTPLSVDYATKKVTFHVSWTNTPTAPYNNRVWIWIDFCPVNGVTPQGFSTATITNPVISGSGTITEFNGRGFFIKYGATNTGTTVTATLSNAPIGKFNWCAYGRGYPPNIGDFNNGTYTLRGTPPFILKDAIGATQTVPGKTIAQSDLKITPITMTDKTGFPSYFCKYVGNDLYMDATTYKCQQRTSGAKNWEAWIKDERDNELYRIVLMPDNLWWLAQNVKLEHYGDTTIGEEITISGCNKDLCGRWYDVKEVQNCYDDSCEDTTRLNTICPRGWLLAHMMEYHQLSVLLKGDGDSGYDYMIPAGTPCPSRNDYGWADETPVWKKGSAAKTVMWHISQNGGWWYCMPCNTDGTFKDWAYHADWPYTKTIVRCNRPL